MTRTPEQLIKIRERTRTKILDAATRVFTKRGFAAANMLDIAREANISVGLIYRHFRTKEDLFGALVSQAAKGLDETRELFSQPLPPWQKFQIFTEGIIEDLRQSDDFSNFMVLVGQTFTTEDFIPEATELKRKNAALISTVAQVIKEGQQQNIFRPGNAEAMAYYYFATIQGLASTKFAAEDRFIPPTADVMLCFLKKEDS